MRKLFYGVLALAISFTSCSDDNDENVVITNAGTLTGGPYTFLVGDGMADKLTEVDVVGNVQGTNTSFIITDEEEKIIGLLPDLDALKEKDFEGAGEGKCYIWYIAYEAGLEGLEVGKSGKDLKGNFHTSNKLEVSRVKAAKLTLDLANLENLGDDFKYEGWVIVDEAPVSTGVFTVNDSGELSKKDFYIAETALEDATKFVLSIEPTVDTDSAPAETKLLAGDFSGSSASVSSTGLVGDFSTSTGKFILATPTDDDATNEFSGVWFLDNSVMPAVAGLDLPTLPAGWKYEGWVVINGTPVSTGTFTDPAAADDNAANSPYKGDKGNGPAYPGEDYVKGMAAGVTFPTDLRDTTIVISVEPSPDNSAAPFTLKPLAHKVSATAMDHTVISMGAGPVQSISGTVTR